MRGEYMFGWARRQRRCQTDGHRCVLADRTPVQSALYACESKGRANHTKSKTGDQHSSKVKHCSCCDTGLLLLLWHLLTLRLAAAAAGLHRTRLRLAGAAAPRATSLHRTRRLLTGAAASCCQPANHALRCGNRCGGTSRHSAHSNREHWAFLGALCRSVRLFCCNSPSWLSWFRYCVCVVLWGHTVLSACTNLLQHSRPLETLTGHR